jgi:DNA mismatch endonuclease (patch repair protein)
MPVSNADYWTKKIGQNVTRDGQHYDDLRKGGWRVEVVWECCIAEGVESILRSLHESPKEVTFHYG